jgi:hypothetical protein
LKLILASILLDTLLSHLKSTSSCKAVYLHVLCTNETAIRFYERRNFQKRLYLQSYYTIDNEHKDGYCYVLYMNKGYPPWTLAYPFRFIYPLRTTIYFSLILFFTDCLENTWLKLKNLKPCNFLLRLFSLQNYTIINYWFRKLINNHRAIPPPTKDFYRIS